MSAADARQPVGYQSPLYAQALGTATQVRTLAASGGHLLVRAVHATGRHDACGAYPVFSCPRPEGLGDDIAALDPRLLSVTLVADPLLPWDPARLAEIFPIVRPLGAHYVVALSRRGFKPSSHHQRALRKAAAHNTEIRVEADPAALVDAWTALYAVLVEQVGITGVRRFSRAIFERMLAVPGTVLFTAWDRDALLGADWYFEDGDRVYAHLSAYSEAGYARAVSYPMLEAALAHFGARGAHILDLGGVPTVEGGGQGLAHFKEGWSTHTVPALLCGRVLDPLGYRQLAAGLEPADGGYFPAYRRGEYG